MQNSELFGTFESYLQGSLKTIAQQDKSEQTTAQSILAMIVDLIQLLPNDYRPLKPFEQLLLGHADAADRESAEEANQLRQQVRELAELYQRCVKPEELVSKSMSDAVRIKNVQNEIEALRQGPNGYKGTELYQVVKDHSEARIKELESSIAQWNDELQVSQQICVDSYRQTSELITNYIRQRREIADSALKTPLQITKPKSDAQAQTVNVTQLRDYMVKVTRSNLKVVDVIITTGLNLVLHCVDKDSSQSVL